MQVVAADLQRRSNCGALVDESRPPLLARRATPRAETDALAGSTERPPRSVTRSPRQLVRAHPERAQARAGSRLYLVRRRVRPHCVEDNEALVTWEAVAGADAYLVERHDRRSRVLGRTAMLRVHDAAPRTAASSWTVRACAA